jgi:hypothetical protein
VLEDGLMGSIEAAFLLGSRRSEGLGRHGVGELHTDPPRALAGSSGLRWSGGVDEVAKEILRGGVPFVLLLVRGSGSVPRLVSPLAHVLGPVRVPTG